MANKTVKGPKRLIEEKERETIGKKGLGRIMESPTRSDDFWPRPNGKGRGTAREGNGKKTKGERIRRNLNNSKDQSRKRGKGLKI